MKKYWTFFKLELQSIAEYRGDMVVYTLGSFISPVISLILWLGVLQSGVELEYSQNNLIIYYTYIIIVSVIASTWGAFFIAQRINTGDFSKNLIMPFSFIGVYFSQNLAEKLYKTSITFISLGLIGYLLFPTLFSEINVSFVNMSLFLASLILSIIIAGIMDILIGLSFIWLHDVEFLSAIDFLTRSIFSGKMIPLVFLPFNLETISYYLPYRYIISFPVEILMGQLNQNFLISGFIMQIFWLVFFVILYKVLYHLGTREYQGYGS